MGVGCFAIGDVPPGCCNSDTEGVAASRSPAGTTKSAQLGNVCSDDSKLEDDPIG